MTAQYITRTALAKRWNASIRTIDRLRKHNLIPWTDLSAGRGKRPIVRFRISDVEQFEIAMLHGINGTSDGDDAVNA